VAAASALWRHARKVRDIEEFWAAVKPCFSRELWDSLPKLKDRKKPAEA
jgi:hypothetical protein